MKKFLIIVSLFLVFCKYAISEEDDRWIYCGTTTDGEYYYDIESINWISGDIVEVWTRAIYSEEGKKEIVSLLIKYGIEPEKAMGLYEVKALWKIDIKNKKINSFSSVWYNKNRNVIYSSSDSTVVPKYKRYKILSLRDEKGNVIYNRGDDNNVSSDWPYIIPDSIGETLWKEMCKLKEIEKLKGEIEKDPDNPLLYFILFQKYSDAFLMTQAKEPLKKCAEIMKKNIVEFKEDKDKSCEYLFKLGITGLKEGNKEFAEFGLDIMKKIAPSSPYITELEEKIKETYP